MIAECEARWFAHEFGPPPQCTSIACREYLGVQLCWVHGVTVEAGMATLQEVLEGRRGQHELGALAISVPEDLGERFA